MKTKINGDLRLYPDSECREFIHEIADYYNVKDEEAFVRHSKFEGDFLYRGLKEAGILVRHFNNDRIKDFLRITIDTDEEMGILIKKSVKIIEQFR